MSSLSASTSALTLLSADTDHSFWAPRLAGKTDLIPNRVNRTWIDPREPGVYLGQCGQYCGTQHAKMLLRVYVDPQEKLAARSGGVLAFRRIMRWTQKMLFRLSSVSAEL